MKHLLSVAAFSALTLGMTACQNTNKEAALVQAHQRTIDSMKIELTRQQVIDSMQDAAAIINNDRAVEAAALAAPVARTQPAASKSVAVTKRRATPTRTRTRSSGYSRNSSYSNGGYASAPAPVYTPAPARKRGWSAKAKGAVIGAGAGAVGGAIINKRNRAAGAVIGGLGGAAIGTGIGAIIDHKNGR